MAHYEILIIGWEYVATIKLLMYIKSTRNLWDWLMKPHLSKSGMKHGPRDFPQLQTMQNKCLSLNGFTKIYPSKDLGPLPIDHVPTIKLLRIKKIYLCSISRCTNFWPKLILEYDTFLVESDLFSTLDIIKGTSLCDLIVKNLKRSN